MQGPQPASASSAAGWDERRTSHHGEGLEGAPLAAWPHEGGAQQGGAGPVGPIGGAGQLHRCALGPRSGQHVNRGAARFCR